MNGNQNNLDNYKDKVLYDAHYNCAPQHQPTKFRQKHFIIAFVILLLVATPILLSFTWSIPVHRELEGIEIVFIDSSHFVERTVTIHGRYRINIRTGSRIFVGYVQISGYEVTAQPGIFRLNSGPHRYAGQRDAIMQFEGTATRYFGRLFSYRMFQETLIMLRSDTGRFSSWESPIIVLGVNNRQDAINKIAAFGLL